MQAIYNKQGYTVGWLNNKDMYDIKGYFVGFIINNAVYNSRSDYRGTLKQSFFRDIGGHVVAFLKGAKNGPALPSVKSLPQKPIKKSKPSIKVVLPKPVTKPIKHSWSKLNWDDFI